MSGKIGHRCYKTTTIYVANSFTNNDKKQNFPLKLNLTCDTMVSYINHLRMKLALLFL